MKRPRATTATVLALTLSLALVIPLVLAGGGAGPGTSRSGGALTAARAPAAAAADSPANFWYGTDSLPIAISGKAPYAEPRIGSPYGGYIGMVGNWAKWVNGCGGKLAWSAADSAAADTNYITYHDGIGTGVYWFMAGPGVDPHYNGTTTEAAAWGARQAAQTLGDIKAVHITYPVVFMDIELPGIAPAPDNGWNAVYTAPCSGRVKTGYIAPAVDRADFNGYRAYILAHSVYIPGVYSAPSIWASIFGTGSAASIPTTDEWTYNGDTSSLSHLPSGWCLTGTSTCAQFFGGVHSSDSEALIWQWTGGGGTDNGYGDFDQIDRNRQR
jgi:hypothetical protein